MRADTLLGMTGEFPDPEALVAAVRTVREAGYTRLDAFTPFPLPELDSLLGLADWAIGWATLVGAFFGAVFGAWIGWYVNVVVYPLNVGGRPPDSWPAFVLPAFETAVLFGALGALICMLALDRLPRLHHPIFEVPGFARATDDRFFLLVAAEDELYHPELTRRLLQRAGALRIAEVAQRWSA